MFTLAWAGAIDTIAAGNGAKAGRGLCVLASL